MRSNRSRRCRPASFPRVNIVIVVAASLCGAALVAPAWGQADEPIDAYATAAERAPAVGDASLLTLDSFARGSEYIPFPAADAVFDAWARAGDKSLWLPLEPEGPGGTFDALSVSGDELERYGRASLFAGGYGPGEKRCVILMYHRFRLSPANKYEVSHADFRAQLEYIARNRYEVIPIGQLVEALQTQEPDLLPRRSVVITVDDGYRSVYDFAWPVLAEYGFPFAVYIYTDYVDVGGKSMTWYELSELAADDLVTVGAHSISHANLASAKKTGAAYPYWLEREVKYPKYRLEAATGRPVRTFAWPYGSFNSYGVSVAIHAGYEGLLTVLPGANSIETSPYYLRRYGIYWHTSLWLFARILEGRPVTDDMWDYELAGSYTEDEFPIP